MATHAAAEEDSQPADTVELAMPSVYADQIERMCRNLRGRGSLTISLQTHNGLIWKESASFDT